MSVNQFFKSVDYFEALTKWVEKHPTSSFNEYVKVRNQLRRQFGVEFLEDWRKEASE